MHNDLALEAINYNTVEAQRTYLKIENVANEMVYCQYFTTNFIPLNGNMKVQKNQDSFTVYMCVDDSFELSFDGITYSYQKGDTVLVPASLTDFQLNGKASILEIYVS